MVSRPKWLQQARTVAGGRKQATRRVYFRKQKNTTGKFIAVVRGGGSEMPCQHRTESSPEQNNTCTICISKIRWGCGQELQGTSFSYTGFSFSLSTCSFFKLHLPTSKLFSFSKQDVYKTEQSWGSLLMYLENITLLSSIWQLISNLLPVTVALLFSDCSLFWS